MPNPMRLPERPARLRDREAGIGIRGLVNLMENTIIDLLAAHGVAAEARAQVQRDAVQRQDAVQLRVHWFARQARARRFGRHLAQKVDQILPALAGALHGLYRGMQRLGQRPLLARVAAELLELRDSAVAVDEDGRRAVLLTLLR